MEQPAEQAQSGHAGDEQLRAARQAAERGEVNPRARHVGAQRGELRGHVGDHLRDHGPVSGGAVLQALADGRQVVELVLEHVEARLENGQPVARRAHAVLDGAHLARAQGGRGGEEIGALLLGRVETLPQLLKAQSALFAPLAFDGCAARRRRN